MHHLGIDVHKKESQICGLADGGEPIERRIRTEPRRPAICPDSAARDDPSSQERDRPTTRKRRSTRATRSRS